MTSAYITDREKNYLIPYPNEDTRTRVNIPRKLPVRLKGNYSISVILRVSRCVENPVKGADQLGQTIVPQPVRQGSLQLVLEGAFHGLRHQFSSVDAKYLPVAPHVRGPQAKEFLEVHVFGYQGGQKRTFKRRNAAKRSNKKRP